MSFSLPESGFKICAVSVSSGQIKLVERGINGHSDSLALSFPHGLLSGMEILTNGLLYSVPEAHSFGKVETDRIIGKWERDSCE